MQFGYGLYSISKHGPTCKKLLASFFFFSFFESYNVERKWHEELVSLNEMRISGYHLSTICFRGDVWLTTSKYLLHYVENCKLSGFQFAWEFKHFWFWLLTSCGCNSNWFCQQGLDFLQKILNDQRFKEILHSLSDVDTSVCHLSKFLYVSIYIGGHTRLSCKSRLCETNLLKTMLPDFRSFALLILSMDFYHLITSRLRVWAFRGNPSSRVY